MLENFFRVATDALHRMPIRHATHASPPDVPPAPAPAAPPRAHDGPGGAALALTALALGAVLTGVWRKCSATHHRRLHHRTDAKHERLQTWEGEGGNPDPVDDRD